MSYEWKFICMENFFKYLCSEKEQYGHKHKMSHTHSTSRRKDSEQEQKLGKKTTKPNQGMETEEVSNNIKLHNSKRNPRKQLYQTEPIQEMQKMADLNV